MTRAPDPRSVACPECQAGVGQPCTTLAPRTSDAWGYAAYLARRSHARRHQAARRHAAAALARALTTAPAGR